MMKNDGEIIEFLKSAITVTQELEASLVIAGVIFLMSVDYKHHMLQAANCIGFRKTKFAVFGIRILESFFLCVDDGFAFLISLDIGVSWHHLDF